MDRKPGVLRSFAYAVALSAMFMLVYGGCLAITSHRCDVGTLYFLWELRIPLVPAMIVPYWTLDLFFVASFFLCADRGELRALALRLASAQLAAGVFFLLFPLRTAYAHPTLHGPFGLLFDLLHGFDLPYNCAPSLHVAIAVILWALYVSKVPYGAVRTVVALWFTLIIVSTLLTWQHHVIDVISGAALGLGCMWVFPLARVSRQSRGLKVTLCASDGAHHRMFNPLCVPSAPGSAGGPVVARFGLRTRRLIRKPTAPVVAEKSPPRSRRRRGRGAPWDRS